jgi:enamine deaminase RidA (YjgF/YER057c/UK114 family)
MFNFNTLICCVVFPSQAVVVDRTMYISGQLGMDPVSGQLVEGGVQAQTKQVITHKTSLVCLNIIVPESFGCYTWLYVYRWS